MRSFEAMRLLGEASSFGTRRPDRHAGHRERSKSRRMRLAQSKDPEGANFTHIAWGFRLMLLLGCDPLAESGRIGRNSQTHRGPSTTFDKSGELRSG